MQVVVLETHAALQATPDIMVSHGVVRAWADTSFFKNKFGMCSLG